MIEKFRQTIVDVDGVVTPHHSTTYLDAANCYRPSSVVCRSITV